MAGHARLSASQTKWWSTCAGALALVEAHPGHSDVSGHYAQLGTCAHALVERCLGEGSEPSDYLDRLIEIIEDGDGNEGTSILRKNAKMPKEASRVVFEVDQDMAEAVECMTDYVRLRCVELYLVDEGLNREERAREVCNLIARGTVRLEEHVVPLPERDDTGGTGDVVIDAWPEVLEVVDYKNGSGVFVPVEGNQQLRSYGLGGLRGAGASDYELVRYTICQPRHMKSPPNGIMYEETTPEELLEWAGWLTKAAERVDDARANVAAGATIDELYGAGLISAGEDGSHCTFCPLLVHNEDGKERSCPAAFARAQELACTDFDDEPDDVAVVTDASELAKLIPWVPFLDKWCKAIMVSGEQLLMSGREVEGQKLVRGKSTRSFVTELVVPDDEDEIVQLVEDNPLAAMLAEGSNLQPGSTISVTEEHLAKMLTDEYNVDADVLYKDPKFVTGPQAEKLMGKDKRAEFNDVLLHKPEGKLTMAPESDPKPAVVVDPADDFDDAED